MKTNVLALLALLAAACADRGDPRDRSDDPAAPFFGPAEKPLPLAEPIDPIAAPPPIAEIAPLPAIPVVATADAAAARRRDAWSSSKFRCRAISTTKLRGCRMQPSAAGWSITFPIADLTCAEVVFDGAGDPAELRGCTSSWLRVPKTIALARGRAGDVWSGGHAGWRWPGDGERYCCPGVWIEAPAALRAP